jgi:uncharacterized protein (DUF952 family)
MTDPTRMIVHICARKTWQSARDAGVYTADTLASEGFIHFSRPDQVLDVANRFYTRQAGLVILWVAPERLDAEIRWESSDGDTFPHVYGPLNLDAVLAVTEFAADAAGTFTQFSYPPRLA